jgi:hypothetical protein
MPAQCAAVCSVAEGAGSGTVMGPSSHWSSARRTRAGAEEAERRAIARVLETGDPKPVVEEMKEVPTIEEFSKVFLATSSLINKPSSVDSKEKLLRFHIVTRLGHLRLDEVTYAVIEDLKLALAQTPINTGKTYVGVKLDNKSPKTLSGKTINNVLTVLSRMLVVARKRAASSRACRTSSGSSAITSSSTS